MINSAQNIRDRAFECLKKYWGYDAFKVKQLDVITHVLNGKDCIVLFPTGGGKSICFQIPALLSEHITIVITPLIALMEDQVTRLKKRGIGAEAIHSGKSRFFKENVLDLCANGRIKLLYISPELLQNDRFFNRISGLQVSIIAIDEAHCISQWGFDFRPAYLKINERASIFANATLIALTATATDRVLEDIKTYSGLREPTIFKESIGRENISLNVLLTENKYTTIKNHSRSLGNHSAIVYVRSRKETMNIATIISEMGIAAHYYHAGLHYDKRAQILEDFINDKIKIVCATNAFGMGLDKTDVRTVIHFDLPPSPEEYVQEFGRAGRDGKQASATMIINKSDLLFARKKLDEKYPSVAAIRKVYGALYKFYGISIGTAPTEILPFSLDNLAKHSGIRKKNIYHGCSILEKNGYIHLFDQRDSRRKAFVKTDIQTVRNNDLPEDEKSLLLTIVRLYEGIMHSVCEISASQIADYTDLKEDRVEVILRKLKRRNCIDYHENPSGGKIQFLKKRLSERSFSIDESALRQERKVARDKVEALMAYIESTACRSNIILDYFGEKAIDGCGKCDNCRNQTEGNKSIKEKRELQNRLEERMPNVDTS